MYAFSISDAILIFAITVLSCKIIHIIHRSCLISFYFLIHFSFLFLAIKVRTETSRENGVILCVYHLSG